MKHRHLRPRHPEGVSPRGTHAPQRAFHRTEEPLSAFVRSLLPILMLPALVLMFGFIGAGMAAGVFVAGAVAGFCLVAGEGS